MKIMEDVYTATNTVYCILQINIIIINSRVHSQKATQNAATIIIKY